MFWSSSIHERCWVVGKSSHFTLIPIYHCTLAMPIIAQWALHRSSWLTLHSCESDFFQGDGVPVNLLLGQCRIGILGIFMEKADPIDNYHPVQKLIARQAQPATRGQNRRQKKLKRGRLEASEHQLLVLGELEVMSERRQSRVVVKVWMIIWAFHYRPAATSKFADGPRYLCIDGNNAIHCLKEWPSHSNFWPHAFFVKHCWTYCRA